MSEDPDKNLDAQLIDVQVPDHLLSRLRDIAALSDQELDLRLCDVPIPSGLVDRIRDEIQDAELDEQVRSVPISHRVVPRARTIPDRRGRSRVLELVVAASLMMALNVGAVAGLGGILSLLRHDATESVALVVVDQGPLTLTSPAESTVMVSPLPGVKRPSPPGGRELDPIEMMPVLAIADGVTPGPAGQLAAEIPGLWDPWDNWLLTRWGVAGYAREEQMLDTDLIGMTPPASVGLAASLSRSVDREFLFRDGSHPPVLTSVDPAAAVLSPPLTTDTTSYELVRRLVSEGRVPDPDQIRAEDFLAAIDYRFAPADPGTLAIRTAAGPSIFNPGSAGLVQVGVRAGPHQSRLAGGTHLTVALEISAAMVRRGHFERARQGLLRLLPSLGADDRLSLVVFSDDAMVSVEESGPEDRVRVSRFLEQLSCSGGANLGAGLQLAISSAIETEAANCPRRRLALITSCRPILDSGTAAGIRRMFDEAVRNDFELDVFDLEYGSESTADWVRLASDAPCTVHAAASADQLRWGLLETVTGLPTLAATEVDLQIAFNPEAVAAYRLIGHEATAVGGLLPGSAISDLHVDQETAVLLEVWLYPSDQQDIASVHLSWTDPASGRVRKAAPQRISALQFASSFEGCPLSLQSAAIAAEAAEVLRRGYNFSVTPPNFYYYRPKPTSLQPVLSVAERVNARLGERCSFQRFVQTLEAAESVGLDDRTASSRAGVRRMIAGRWRESKQ
jgi:hypothetical protein